MTISCLVIWVSGLVYAAERTIQSHAYVFNNTHGLFIVLINFAYGQKPYKSELIGLSLAVVGILFLAFDPGAHRKDGTTSSIFVCLVDLGSAIFGALYFLLNAKNVKELPICMLILTMNIHIWLL